jgi:hypothetical protein
MNNNKRVWHFWVWQLHNSLHPNGEWFKVTPWPTTSIDIMALMETFRGRCRAVEYVGRRPR